MSDELSGLSSTYYSASPAVYLNHRLASLVALGEASRVTGQTTPDTAEFHQVKVNLKSSSDELERYAILESTVLLHHAAETLLRLYLAHRGSQSHPWMELLELTNARAFKDQVKNVRASLDEPSVVQDLVETCSSIRLDDTAPAELHVAWNKHCDAIVTLFRRAADVVLDDAPFYNSAKHGLAAVTGKSTFKLGADDEAHFTHSGDALTIIELERKRQERTWRLTTLWVNIDRNLGTIVILNTVIDSLWNSAKQRRGFDHDPDKIGIFDGDATEEALRARPQGGSLLRMSLPIATTVATIEQGPSRTRRGAGDVPSGG